MWSAARLATNVGAVAAVVAIVALVAYAAVVAAKSPDGSGPALLCQICRQIFAEPSGELGFAEPSSVPRGSELVAPLQQSLAAESGVADAHLRYVTGAARPEAQAEFPSGAWQRGYVFSNSELARIFLTSNYLI